MPSRPFPPRPDTLSPPLRRRRSRTVTCLDFDQLVSGDRPVGGTGGGSVQHASEEDAWDMECVGRGLLGVPGRRQVSGNGSTSSLASSAGRGGLTDSAYGTLDEREVDDDAEFDDVGCFSPISAQEEGHAVARWKDRVAESFKARSRRRVEAALGPDAWRLRVRTRREHDAYPSTSSLASSTDTAQSSPEISQTSVFTFDLSCRAHTGIDSSASVSASTSADSSFDSLESLLSPSTTSLGSSRRSSPEPSECGGDSDSAATRLTMVSKRRRLLSPALFDECGFLARRHTLPRRAKAKEPHTKVSFTSPRPSPSAITRRTAVSPSAPSSTLSLSSSPETAVSPPDLLPSPFRFLSLPPLTSVALKVTLLVSLSSAVLHPALIMPLSPVALRHVSSPSEFFLLGFNALLAPFLVNPSMRGVALGAANFHLLKDLEASASGSGMSQGAQAGLAGLAWTGVVALRVLCGWVFGRVLGWAHPELFSSRAVHEGGAGLAPLLLALYLPRSSTSSLKQPSYLPATILAANFATPVCYGGAGMWFAICAAAVGLVLSLASAALSAFSRRLSPSSTAKEQVASFPHRSGFSLTQFLILLTLPLVARQAVPSLPLLASTSASFAHLHPTHDNLLTVLLMTAPRPGNPDFLLQTIESWLGAFPDPSTDSPLQLNTTALPLSPSFSLPSLSSRLRLVVYTHFSTHPMYDLAQSRFSSPKASHYITWHRDPRALSAGNRLDQRLHVARGLEYAASLGGAYVLLTEDDFPLCEDGAERRAPGELLATPVKERTWTTTWEKFQAALVATNELMPDIPGDDSSSPPTPGHCGLFLSTGGSGLAIRTPIAARLPALLLGADDPHGYEREAAAARGEVPAQQGGKDADTPDLVIQDCLRGKIDECRSLCAPAAHGGEGPFLPSSARLPGVVLGDRVGKGGLAGTERLLQRHLGYNASTLPGRKYGKEEWACGWRQPFNGEPDVLTV
ncbi:hypothetical protein JCM11251_003907 [Rhodosporidiobolus azoricus]